MSGKAHLSKRGAVLRNRGENIMADQKGKKPKKKQRRSFLDRVDKFAVALYWVVKTILLLIDWFTR